MSGMERGKKNALDRHRQWKRDGLLPDKINNQSIISSHQASHHAQSRGTVRKKLLPMLPMLPMLSRCSPYAPCMLFPASLVHFPSFFSFSLSLPLYIRDFELPFEGIPMMIPRPKNNRGINESYFLWLQLRQ